MPLAYKSRVIFAKTETTPGIYSAPAASDAVLCANLEVSPLEGSAVDRNVIRPYFGSFGSFRAESYVTLDFETELAGSGAAGTAPQWDNLMRACMCSSTVFASPTASTTVGGSTINAIKLAATASAVDDFYVGLSLTIAGETREITGYNGATKTANVSRAFSTAPAAAEAYSISAGVVYQLASDISAATSLSFIFNLNGVQHEVYGAKGTFSLDLTIKEIPTIKWKFTGLYRPVNDTVQMSGSFLSWQTPVPVSVYNTTDFDIMGWLTPIVSKFSLDVGNSVNYRQLIGSESVAITERKPVGSVQFEAPKVAVKDVWALVKADTASSFTVKHGTVAGNIVGITAPVVQPGAPKYSEQDGIAMLELSLSFQPLISATNTGGNNEFRITAK